VYGVGFDLDHTLAIDNKLERVAFLHLLEAVIDQGGHPRGSLTEETENIDALLALQRGGAFSIDEAVRRFVAERGVEPSVAHVERFRSLALAMAGDFVIPLPGAKTTLAVLRKRGFALAVLSNGWNPLQRLKADRAGFDGPVIASADIGIQKPDPRAFDALLETLGTEAANTWYVGDDPRADVAGSSRAGLRSVWLDAEGKAFPTDVEPPHQRIDSLDALLELLPAGVRT
jgi:HAD superfamily hydrolase (TIGR01509 family)